MNWRREFRACVFIKSIDLDQPTRKLFMAKFRALVHMHPKPLPLTACSQAHSRACAVEAALLLFLAAGWGKISSLRVPGALPGAASATLDGNVLTIGNNVIRCDWRIEDNVLKLHRVVDEAGSRVLSLATVESFRLMLADGQVIRASDLRLAARPAIAPLAPEPSASILARRFGRQMLAATLVSEDGALRVQWRALLRDGANAVRQEYLLEAAGRPLAIEQTRLIELPAAGTRIMETAPDHPSS